MPRTPRHHGLPHRARTRVVGQPLEHLRIASSAPAPHRRPAHRIRRRPPSAPSAASASASLRLRRRPLPRPPPHDRRPPPLARPAEAPKLGGRNNLAAFDFPNGSLTLTEAGTKRRASLQSSAAKPHSPPRPRRPRRLLPHPRSLPRSAHARKPHPQARPHRPAHPLRHRQRLLRRNPPRRPALAHRSNPQAHPRRVARLYTATRDTLKPGSTASTPKPQKASPKKSPPSAPRWPSTAASISPARAAAQPIQRIRYADNETNYCSRLPDRRKVLADRSLSRLLGKDWPRTLDELEALKK